MGRKALPTDLEYSDFIGLLIIYGLLAVFIEIDPFGIRKWVRERTESGN